MSVILLNCREHSFYISDEAFFSLNFYRHWNLYLQSWRSNSASVSSVDSSRYMIGM